MAPPNIENMLSVLGKASYSFYFLRLIADEVSVSVEPKSLEDEIDD